MAFRLDVIDVSNNQDATWPIEQVPPGLGVFHKLTEGRTFLDPMWAARWPFMRATFPARGPYHWLTPSWRSPVDEQAAWFLEHLQPWLPFERGEGPFLDLEELDNPGDHGSTDVRWSPPADVHRWCELVEAATGVTVAVYVGRNYPQALESVAGRPWVLPDYRALPSPPGVMLRQWAGAAGGAIVAGRRVDSNQIEDLAAWATWLRLDPKPPEGLVPSHATFAIRADGSIVQLVYGFDGLPHWRETSAAGEAGVVFAAHPGGTSTIGAIGEAELGAMGPYSADADAAWLAARLPAGSGPSAVDVVHAMGAALLNG